jgi:hypothetical protein
MVKAGISIEGIDPIIIPNGDNGSRTAFLAVGTNADGRRAFAIGESDPSNLTPNTVAAKYPTIMAFKRAIDRLVLDLLELFELYSDVEFSEPAGATRAAGSSPNGEHTPTHTKGNGACPDGKGRKPSPSRTTDDSGELALNSPQADEGSGGDNGKGRNRGQLPL